MGKGAVGSSVAGAESTSVIRYDTMSLHMYHIFQDIPSFSSLSDQLRPFDLPVVHVTVTQ